MARRSALRALPRLVRIGLWSLAGLVGLVIVAGVVVVVSFDPDSLKPRIVAAVKQQTGRDLTLQGPIRIGLSLQPTLTVQGVSLANPPGFSRPQMATLERLDLKLALIPLLSSRVEINRLVLVKPDILLERDAQGRPNWVFTPTVSPAAPQSAASGPADRQRTLVSVADVRVENGTVTWRDDRAGRSTVLGLTSFQASAASPDANLNLSASAVYNGTPFTLAGETGPLSRLQDPAATTPWPVRVKLDAAGATMAVDGTIAQPLHGRGYAMKLTATVPDLAALAPFLPGSRLPPLHDVSLAAQLTDTGAPLPQISGVSLRVGKSDLTSVAAGLKLDTLDVKADRLDQPAHLAAHGSFGDAPATVAGSLGAPATLLPGTKAAGPMPLDLHIQALGSSLTVKGTVSQGKDGRLSVQAEVVADKIDLDGLSAALVKAPAPTPATGSAGATSAVPAAPAAKPAGNGRVIPDTPIPFGLLRLADADVRLNVAQLMSGGVTYRTIATHLDLHGGKLRLDPVSADLPEGHVDAALAADASLAAPAVALKLQIPALALQPLLTAMGKPAFITGNLQVQADLRGAGATPHAIAASLDGSLSLAMANGTVDNRALGSTLGSVLRDVNLLDMVGRGGTSQVQCFVARFDVNRGLAVVRSLALASSLLTVDGEGSLNLGAETFDLRLRPQARVAGTGLVVPLRVGGTFRAPSTAPDPGTRDHPECGNRGGYAGRRDTARYYRRCAGRAGASRRFERGGLRGLGCSCGPVGRRGAGRPRGSTHAAAEAAEFGGNFEAIVTLRGTGVKRFWDTAVAEPIQTGFAILLDGKPMHLPGGAVLRVDAEPLARAIAEEWQTAGGEKGGEMSFADTPLTRLAGTAQQRIAPDPAPTVDALARYAESDLLCYRADAPAELVARQTRDWQPWVDWVADAYGAPLRVSTGVVYTKQHRGSVAALRSAVAALDIAALAAFGVAVPALGSLVLDLAMADGRLDAASAHALGVLDELFQAEAWGEDSEAAARRRAIAADVALAERFLRLTRPMGPA